MYVCMHVCIYVYTDVWNPDTATNPMCVYMYKHMYVSACELRYSYPHFNECMHALMYVCMYVCMKSWHSYDPRKTKIASSENSPETPQVASGGWSVNTESLTASQAMNVPPYNNQGGYTGKAGIPRLVILRRHSPLKAAGNGTYMHTYIHT